MSGKSQTPNDPSQPPDDPMGEHQLHELDQLIQKSRRLIDELEFLLDEPHGSHQRSGRSRAHSNQDLDRDRPD